VATKALTPVMTEGTTRFIIPVLASAMMVLLT
jgi:hypothetical protein